LKTVVLVSLPAASLAVTQSLFGYGSGLASNEQQAMARQEAFTTFWPSIQRACASFGSSNAAGAFFSAAGLVALLHALLLSRHRIRYLAMTGLLGLGLAATFSRGAIAGLLIGVLFIASVIGRSRLRWILAVSLAGLLSLGYIFTPMEQVLGYLRVNDDVLSASVSRVQAWQAAWTMIREHPLSGIGFYGFKQEMLVNEGDPQAPMHPHNGLLKGLVETGIFGGLAYLCYLAVFLRTATSTLRRCVQQPELLWIFSSIAAVGMCFFGQELVDAGLTMGGSSIAILFATLLGLQTSLRNSLDDLTPSPINL
jgi:O-antigen ligase